jgi:2-polyprenyl-3-methyl-5-hydroxy-6-metoxy-1,4-benzoquinol methylase
MVGQMSSATGAEPARNQRAPSQPEYVIRGGHEGKRRLELLGRIFWPTTYRLLRRTGIREGMTCLDAGCGGGDVSLALARLVGPSGRVLGIDGDALKLNAARQEAARRKLSNVEFQQANIYEWSAESAFDRVYARFLLTHLPDCATALSIMRHALRPGGILIVEDIDFTGSFCYPPCAAYARYLDLYRRVIERRKGDADIGPKLHGMFVSAGLQGVQLVLVQPFHMEYEENALSLSTLVNIADAVLSEGLAEPEELEHAIAELDAFTKDPTTIIGLPRVFQAWGCRP